jgi:RNA polymerase sigma-70 factor, ECF subfamily
LEHEIDRQLAAARSGDPRAARELAEAVYLDFRRLAKHYLRSERPDHTLQPTALANEVYLRLFDAPFPDVSNRAEFFVAAARTIRRILIEHARTRRAAKRGGDRKRVVLDGDSLAASSPQDGRLVDLDTALERLAEVDPGKARIVELRFFGGFSVAEVAELTGSSERTVAREWRVARAFLESEVGGEAPQYGRNVDG